MFRKIFWVMGITSLLTACGGGSNGANVNQGNTTNSAPTVSNITITDQNGGAREVGDTLVGSYTYNDADGDAEGATTFRWLRTADAVSATAGRNAQARDGFTAIPGATGKTYVVTADDQGKTLLFEVTPVAQAGTTQGDPTSVDPANDTSGGSAVIPAANAAPTATNVSITGTAQQGQTLTGNYTYADAENDAQGTSTFRWLRNDAAISGATTTTYVLQAADVGATIKFAVTPVASAGTTTGTEVISAATSAVTAAATNSAPTATNVNITGTARQGQTLTGNYTYSDAESDAEGISTYRWLRNDTAISGATSKTYVLTADDVGATIKFAVTPVASAGTTTGTEVISAATSAVVFAPSDALLSDQWYIENPGTAPSNWGSYKNLTQGADMRVRGAWNLGATGEGVTVTVVDDGVDFQHPDLADQELAGKSGSYEEGNETTAQPPTAQTGDSSWTDHGTGCAGIIAAKSDANGVVGIAAKSKLVGIRTLGVTNISSAAVYAEVKMLQDDVSQVSNHSYGPADDGRLYPQSTRDYDRIKALVTQSNKDANNKPRGHVMLFAAGNGRAYVPRQVEPSDIDSGFSSYDSATDIIVNLGDYAGLDMSQQNPYVISVSGFDANNKDVTYAEAGPATLVAGATGDSSPGPQGFNNPAWEKKQTADMATTGRAGMDYKLKAQYSSHRTNGTSPQEPAGYNFAFNGTSAATPAVSGVVALIRSANPDLTWRDVRWILARTARKIQAGGTITDQTTGAPSAGQYAKPIWSTSGNSTFGYFSHYFGYGAANAEAAVTLAKSSGYQKLPDMTECSLTVTNNVADKDANTTCPSTIEFVQVEYTVNSGTNVSNLEVGMTLNNDSGKTIYLLTPTTCKQSVNCSVSSDTSVKGGTVGFMGDFLQDGAGKGFQFTVKTNGSASTDVVITKVNVFGFTTPFEDFVP